MSRAIVNSNRKLVIEIPTNNLLDLIDKDLWNIIINYHNKCFAIGRQRKKYPGFRQVNCFDFSGNIKDYFLMWYQDTGGIYCMDFIDHRKPKYLCGDNECVFVIHGIALLYKKNIRPGNIVVFDTYSQNNLEHIKLVDRSLVPEPRMMGLFILI